MNPPANESRANSADKRNTTLRDCCSARAPRWTGWLLSTDDDRRAAIGRATSATTG